ncbi:MAG: flavodoxin-dependent (E)-4-hydroxy-3-methylbut-2-enyl-diphosphate synthase [bacterium]|nr:flavodoxin-dependent (E)-4-hydroxy-3-methylbut-2-enyl-diphosphate synthase [bacterium]MDT8366594.1 flavodoxin-dependent (E)-4-hydroxy-3-methylbut-2-enyl-diphosphate synthase [bacterium]
MSADFPIVRRPTRPTQLGQLIVGGGAPVSVQSMTNTPTADMEATLDQVRALASAGCEIVRVSVPDEDALTGFDALRKNVRLPLVADIHFDHKLAVGSLLAGADAVRINPGNIGASWKVREIVEAASDRGASIRVGVNAGSLERDILRAHGHPTPEALVQSAIRSVKLLEGMNFFAIKVSVKASDPVQSVQAYRLLSEEIDYPLHLGVTEAGTPLTGSVRTAAALSLLLADGIGDTIRVSLSGDPLPEVHSGFELLRSLGLRTGARVVACPTCARAEIDVAEWAGQIEEKVRDIRIPLRIAVMGCPVNGPGEAREADVGLAGGKGNAILFVKGQVIKKVSPDEAVEALMEEVEKLVKESEG